MTVVILLCVATIITGVALLRPTVGSVLVLGIIALLVQVAGGVHIFH